MKNVFLQTAFLFITFLFISCLQKSSSKFDPREELDLNYTSILIEPETTIRDVTKHITGTWIGNYDWLNKSNKKATYVLTIKHDHEEFFTITQKTMQNNKELNTQTSEVSLATIDDKNYVFDVDGNIPMSIHYLSDKQLKLGEHIL